MRKKKDRNKNQRDLFLFLFKFEEATTCALYLEPAFCLQAIIHHNNKNIKKQTSNISLFVCFCLIIIIVS